MKWTYCSLRQLPPPPLFVIDLKKNTFTMKYIIFEVNQFLYKLKKEKEKYKVQILKHR